MTRKPSINQTGFTLIELVMLIVILGVLAAVALPKFVNLGSDARIATVEAAKGSIATAANLAMLKCQTVPGCYVANSGVKFAGPGGVSGRMYNGFPTGRSRVPGFFGIKDWILISGFTLTEYPTNYSEYTQDGAPDPANCKVTYIEAKSFGGDPDITSITTGC